MPATDRGRRVGLYAVLAASAVLWLGGCSRYGESTCGPEPYVPRGPRVEAVEDCPVFPASCPLDCDAETGGRAGEARCDGDGLRCEDCAHLQAWLDEQGDEGACVIFEPSAEARAFSLDCGS